MTGYVENSARADNSLGQNANPEEQSHFCDLMGEKGKGRRYWWGGVRVGCKGARTDGQLVR